MGRKSRAAGAARATAERAAAAAAARATAERAAAAAARGTAGRAAPAVKRRKTNVAPANRAEENARRFIDEYNRPEAPQPTPCRLKLGLRSSRDRNTEDLTWQCDCGKLNLPRRCLLADIPVLECECGRQADIDFDFSLGDVTINDKKPIVNANIKTQGPKECALCATAANIEITLQMRSILAGEEVDEYPEIDLGDLHTKYDHARNKYKVNIEGKNNADTIIILASIAKHQGVVSDTGPESTIHKLPEYVKVKNNFYDIVRVLADGYPLTTGIITGKKFQKLKPGQIYKAPGEDKFVPGKSKIGHAILLIGAGRIGGMNYYHFINSWGKTFCVQDGNRYGFGMVRASDIRVQPIKFIRYEEDIEYHKNLASTDLYEKLEESHTPTTYNLDAENEINQAKLESSSEEPSGPENATKDVQDDAWVAGSSGAKPNAEDSGESSSADNGSSMVAVLHSLPQAELRLLCSLLAHDGSSDNAYLLVAEVLKRVVALAPFICCHFINELARSMQNLTVCAMKELHLPEDSGNAILSTSLANGMPVLRVLQALTSLLTSIQAEVTDCELIPGGRNIRVTEENKHEYVDRVAEHCLTTAIRPQINAFMEGFHELIPCELISIFNDKEFELLISGLPDIDLDYLKANTEYSGYGIASPVIQWFWETVQGFSKEDKAQFPQFVTGTSKVSLECFSALQGISGPQRLQVHKAYSSTNHLPSAHICFNNLDLPEYTAKDQLQERLLLAIHEANERFGIG